MEDGKLDDEDKIVGTLVESDPHIAGCWYIHGGTGPACVKDNPHHRKYPISGHLEGPSFGYYHYLHREVSWSEG